MDNVKRYTLCLICLLVMASCLCIRARAAETAGLSGPATAAKSAILIDASTRRPLYEKNSNERLQMASTTKIMTTLLTIEAGELDEFFEINYDDIKTEGSSMGLKPGDIVSRRILAYGMMLPSGNDAANAAAISVGGSIEDFVAMMNERADSMGLTDTNFVTPSGLDDYTDCHYSTARDMAMLAAEALENETFRQICGTRSICLESGNGEEIWLSNTNRLLDYCDGIIGVKTGFTDKAKRCLVSACERDGVTLICVTLNDPNDWLDHSNLYDYAFGLYESRSFEGVSLQIPGISSQELFQIESEDFCLPLTEEDYDRVKRVIIAPRFVYPPYDDGKQVGSVLYTLDGRTLAQKELVLRRGE